MAPEKAPPGPQGAAASGPDPARRPADPRILRQQELVRRRLRDIDRVLVVMSGKGGVGKSSVAASLATELARSGKKVGLLDMDLTGPDLPRFLGVEKARPKNVGDGMGPIPITENLVMMSLAYLLPDPNAAVVWRGPMKMGAIRQLITDVSWGALDYLIIDLPPGTSDEPLSVAQNIPDADGVIIVTTPHTVSILDVTKSIAFARQVGLYVLGLVENMSGLECPHCAHDIPLFGSGLGESLAREMEVPFLGRIPIDPAAAGDGSLATPAMLREGGPAQEAFRAVVGRIVEETARRPPRDKPRPGTGPLPMV